MRPSERMILARIAKDMAWALMNPPSQQLTATKWWAQLVALAGEIQVVAGSDGGETTSNPMPHPRGFRMPP